MPLEPKQQYSFALGQVNRSFYRYVNTEEYWKSAKQLVNIMVSAQGSALKRCGTLSFKDVTEDIGTQESVRLMFRTMYTPDNFMVTVGLLLVNNVLYIGIVTDTSWDYQTLNLTDYTNHEAQQIDFVSIRDKLLLLYSGVQPHQITFDGINFTQELFEFSQQATFDLAKIDYYKATVDIVKGANPGDLTMITVDLATWPNIADWVGGVIIGPGPDPDSPYGMGTIKTAEISGGKSVFGVLPQDEFNNSSASSNYTGANLSIQQPLFTDSLGYPSKGAHYQDRVFLIGHPATPLTILGSKLGIENNFNVGVGDPTDAIAETISVEGTGNLLFINVGKHLEIFSQNSELAVPDDSQGIEPTNFEVKFQTNYKIYENCAPVNFQNYTFFAGKNGRSIYKFEQVAAGQEDTYTTRDMATYSSELINFPKKLATFFGIDQSSIMLAVLNSDSTVVLFQYNEEMEIAAWTPMVFNDDVQVIDMDSDGTSVYFLVRYLSTNLYKLEKFTSTSNFYVDGAIPVSISLGQTEVTGLSDFEDATISIANDHIHLGDYKVLGGKISLDEPARSAFSGYVGLGYSATIEPLDLVDYPQLVYNFRATEAFYVDYIDSLAITINGQEIPYQNFKDIQNGNPLQLQSGTFEKFNQNGFKRYQTMVISQSKPVRMEISSLGYRLTATGR